MNKTMIMKKLSEEHYIVVDDSEIKEGDWVVSGTKTIVQCMYPENVHHEDIKKITHSTQPLEWFGGEIIFLSEVKELLGVVDVEKKALEISPVELDEDEFDVNETHRVTWIDGYNQALEDNKDKKYTREDLLDAYTWGFLEGTERGDDVTDSVNKFSQALQPKTEWEVEIVDGKLKLKQ